MTAPGTALHVPHSCDVEVASALRGNLLGGVIEQGRAGTALAAYRDLPLRRHGHLKLLARVLQLRENFTAYDACYVALAEVLGAGLLTADDRLAAGVRGQTELELIEA